MKARQPGKPARSWPRPALAVLALALCALLASACGSSDRHSVARPASPTAAKPPIVAHVSGTLLGDEDDDDSARDITNSQNSGNDNDADSDNDRIRPLGYYDGDDRPVQDYGHAAGAAEWRTIAALVERYLLAAASSDGATACSLMYSLRAESIPEDYGEAAGPSYSRGHTCAVVMSKIFAHAHAQLTGPADIVAIRVVGHQGVVVLGSKTQPARFVNVRSELGRWRIYDMLGSQLP